MLVNELGHSDGVGSIIVDYLASLTSWKELQMRNGSALKQLRDLISCQVHRIEGESLEPHPFESLLAVDERLDILVLVLVDLL